MSRQLLRNSKVVVVYKGIGYELKALSTISADTTLNNVSAKRKTLFSNVSRSYSITNRVNPTSISLSLYFTKSRVEELMFTLLGLTKQADRYSLPDVHGNVPELFELYIINSDMTQKFSPCFIEAMDISLNKVTPLSASITINAANGEVVQQNNVTSSFIQGSPTTPTPVNLQLGDDVYNGITNLGISIQQEASWRDDKSLFTQEEIYAPSKALITDLTFSVTATNNLDTNLLVDTPVYSNILIQQAGLTLHMDNSKVIPRISPSSIYTNSFDISPDIYSGDTYFLMENTE